MLIDYATRRFADSSLVVNKLDVGALRGTPSYCYSCLSSAIRLPGRMQGGSAIYRKKNVLNVHQDDF